MTTACVCYTTDTSYLFPTFASAVQARANVSVDIADVVILGFDISPDASRVFSQVCAREGIIYLEFTRADIRHASAMMARLFLGNLLPDRYERFLYIDGDTQIKGSLDGLLDTVVPAGKFFAVADPMVFALGDSDRHGKKIEEHFQNMGISPDQEMKYFNTGVIYADRNGWHQIGLDAWHCFEAQPTISRFPDQDVLNLVGLKHCLPLSLAWNFPVFMFNARVANSIKPRIIHYMSQPKPWEGIFPPWKKEDNKYYRDIIRKYTDLSVYCGTMTARVRIKYYMQQRYKKVMEYFTWARSKKNHRILAYEASLSGNR